MVCLILLQVKESFPGNQFDFDSLYTRIYELAGNSYLRKHGRVFNGSEEDLPAFLMKAHKDSFPGPESLFKESPDAHCNRHRYFSALQSQLQATPEQLTRLIAIPEDFRSQAHEHCFDQSEYFLVKFFDKPDKVKVGGRLARSYLSIGLEVAKTLLKTKQQESQKFQIESIWNISLIKL